MFGYHSKQRITLQVPLLALHLSKSYTETIMRTANCHLRGMGERNGIQRRTMVSFGRSMMQAMELLRLAKRHEATLIMYDNELTDTLLK